ncbi:Tom22-domain-containing protein [Hypoxylon rubiginosum]|uniref:Tom22-domain-containing protein n=1 Tax=Hypoxylon rubiginosum TaxID=110542 RepID=A0ACB9Z1A4_9PEZI|nr:Tom22-domain-containing protein [Hypoxylon rubiginosum]
MEHQAEFEEFPPAPPNSPVRPAKDDSLYFNYSLTIHAVERSNSFQSQHSKMVQLTEVVDEHFQEGQAGPEEDEDFTDTDSEISTESDYDPTNETLAERLYALRDIIPPTTRNSIASKFNATTGAVKSVLSFGGKTLWVLGTSALIIGVPWTLAWAEEQQVIEMEKEMKMREMGGDILTGGAIGGAASGQDNEVKPAL